MLAEAKLRLHYGHKWKIICYFPLHLTGKYANYILVLFLSFLAQLLYIGLT